MSIIQCREIKIGLLTDVWSKRNNEKYTCKSWSILWLQVGKGNVHTALSLIGFEKDLQAAMEFVFGSAFVCNDMNTAKKVTFDDRIMKKSVTLEGDSFDPAGTLTGGRLTLYGYLYTPIQSVSIITECWY